MKKFWIAIIITVVLVLTIVLVVTQTKKEPAEIKIGAILPLTGNAALAGLNAREGIELAVEEINSKGGINGIKIKMIYEDTQADPKTAVAAVNKLIKVDKVPYIIDNSISSVTLAVAPICEENKTVLLATGATAPKISAAGDFIFRIWNSDAVEGERMAMYTADILKLKRIGILYINNDYGIGLKDVFQSALNKIGIDLAAAESFEQGEQQYQTQLTKLIVTQPEAIYLVGYSIDCIKIVQQAKELRYKGVWLGTTVMLDPTVIKAFKKTDYGLYYPVNVLPDTSSPIIKSFRDKFFAKYQKEAPALSDVGYDAIMLLKLAIGIEGSFDGEKIRKGLIDIKGYEGASGLIKFDENGDVHKPIDIKVLK
jgi:branched-chain amino acid transport system substrate-binding protein